ncbi:metallophosphatase family protein [Desulfosarcina ovata subsp. sediminis]|uniref:Metallophosphatase family protein n=1 Tax=Desulfosarcina ovata subsp. sediminis TaxID=885957 RepID=A0A5K7ZCJ2_9BACT|nr:metallophosphoesterase family protein [Desulfosarcina ovata]BBO79712.1 metallophosphatase family protein [Desulfosarcina ovata subsp. sediminis]
MKMAIISDIHGNYEALLSVTEDIKKSEVDKIICLGDFIGYGPQPEEVAQYLIENDIPCVLGNHENAIMNKEALANFNVDAMISIEITRKLISDKTLEFMSKLPANLIIENMLFVHGTPPDSINTYLNRLSDDELSDIFNNMEQQIAFIGHTHDPLYCCFDGEVCDFKMLYPGINQIDPSMKHIINVGSVGQPRDGNSDAKYVIFDDAEFTVYLRYVKYDIDKTAKLIQERNFPKYNADRLYQNWVEVLH